MRYLFSIDEASEEKRFTFSLKSECERSVGNEIQFGGDKQAVSDENDTLKVFYRIRYKINLDLEDMNIKQWKLSTNLRGFV